MAQWHRKRYKLFSQIYFIFHKYFMSFLSKVCHFVLYILWLSHIFGGIDILGSATTMLGYGLVKPCNVGGIETLSVPPCATMSCQ